MATKDISDVQVCRAYVISKLLGARWPNEILADISGEPEKVCWSAMSRAFDRGFINYGVSLRSGWLTSKGKELLELNPPS